MAVEHRGKPNSLLAELECKTGMVLGREFDAQLLAHLLHSFASAHNIYEDVTINIDKSTEIGDLCDPWVRIHWLSKPKIQE
jgi:hypothetical protein